MKKNVIVTGGAKGIGLEISKNLILNGFFTIIIGRTKRASLYFDNNIFKEKENYIYIESDLTHLDNRKKIVDFLELKNIRIYGLINNAAIGPFPRKDILECEESSFRDLMLNNLIAPFFFTQLISNYIIKNKVDFNNDLNYIVNISSISSYTVSLDRSEYCISKAGLSMSSKLWAAKLGQYGIQVLDIQPGIIKKDLDDDQVFSEFDNDNQNNLSVIKRWGKSIDVAKVVCSIFNGGMPYITGSSIVVDGGMHINRL